MREPPVAIAAAEPLFLRVYRPVAREILAGGYIPGQRLPSERTLAARYRVSKETARKALTKLAADGLVVATRGRGWFARGAMSEPANALLSFTDLAESIGATTTSRVLRAHTREATAEEAELFSVSLGAPLFVLSRVRLLDATPIAIDDSVVPLARAPNLPGLDWTSVSLFEALKQHGVISSWARVIISSEPADLRRAEALGITPGQPLLVVAETTHDQNHAVIEHGMTSYRADRYKFQATLTRMLD